MLTGSWPSGTTAIGGLALVGGGVFPETGGQLLGNVSVLVSSVNIVGGFLITQVRLPRARTH